MALPKTVPELRGLLSSSELVSEADFFSAVPRTIENCDVDGAINLLCEATAPWANGVHPGEKLLTAHQANMLRDEQIDKLCCDHWRIRKPLGRGGMGEVFAARHLRTGRIEAIKVQKTVFRNDREKQSIEARFPREVCALAKLSHPGVPQFYTDGSWGGVPFFAMEYIKGKTLRESAQSSQAEIELAIRWFLEIASILAHVHSRGILHRDLKPSNILISEDDGRIVILDLGLCLLAKSSRITHALIGTEEIMAPEAWVDGHDDITAASDIYSLGCTFYLVLTGRMPFLGNTVQLQQQHRNTPAPRVRVDRPECPQWLDDLVDKMLEKNPIDRIVTAIELESELLRGPSTVHYDILKPEPQHPPSFESDKSSVELELELIRFDRQILSSIERLVNTEPNISVSEFAIRGLESSLETWKKAIECSGTPLPTRLIALNDLLVELDRALCQEWPDDIRGAIVDSLVRNFTNVLVYLADWLTEDFLAESSEVRFELIKVRSEIEGRFASWSDALMGRSPHRNVLDVELCKCIQGPHHKPLAVVLNRFDRRLSERFHDAVRHQLEVVSNDDGGRLVRDFLLDEAIPFWGSRLPQLSVNRSEQAVYIGECLADLLGLITSSTPRVLDCIPKAAKALQLDLTRGDETRKKWTTVMCERLNRELGRLRELAIVDDEFRAPFYEAMDILRPSIEGSPRSGGRAVLRDIETKPPLHGLLKVRDKSSRYLPCEILDVRYDLLGIKISVSSSGSPHEHNLERSISFIISDNSSGAEERYSLSDCVIEIPLQDGSSFYFNDLLCAWWTLDASQKNPSTRVGIDVLVAEGNLAGLCEHISSVYGITLSPGEKFQQ